MEKAGRLRLALTQRAECRLDSQLSAEERGARQRGLPRWMEGLFQSRAEVYEHGLHPSHACPSYPRAFGNLKTG